MIGFQLSNSFMNTCRFVGNLQSLKYTEDEVQQMRRQMQAEFEKRCEQMRREHEQQVEAQCEHVRQEWEERSRLQSQALKKEYTDQLTAKEAQWSVETEELLAAAVSRDKEKDEEVERLQQQVTDMRLLWLRVLPIDSY